MNTRFVVNALVIAIIFASVDNIIFHHFKLFSTTAILPNLIFLGVSIIISSPFIWGMLFALKERRFLAWLLTLVEVTILSIIYFEALPTALLFILAAITLFTLSYKQLGPAYGWFETKFVSNIQNKNKDNTERYDELAPWETHLVEFEVGDNSRFINQTLDKLQLRQRFGINVVAIAHGERVIPAPRGEEKIISQDKLIVLGNDKQLEAFQEELFSQTTSHKPRNFLNNFALKAIILSKGHKLAGKTIRDSGIRENIKGMVVGLERKGVRILNPDPTTTLQEEDMVLVVGEVNKLKKF